MTYILGLWYRCGRQCLFTIACFAIYSSLILPCVSVAENIASVVGWLKTAGRNGRGRKRPWPDLRYYSDHWHRVTKDSMESISFDRGISQLQVMSIIVWAIIFCNDITIIMIAMISMVAMLMEMITAFHLDMDYSYVHQKRCVSTRHETD